LPALDCADVGVWSRFASFGRLDTERYAYIIVILDDLLDRPAPTMPSARERLPILDLFAGAGGLSIGLEEAGFAVVGAVEWLEDACQTFADRHLDAVMHESDIATLSFGHLRGEVAVVVGGPPCQPWSTGGKRLGTNDPRDGFPQFLRVLREVEPEAFLIENVAGLIRGAKRAYFLQLRDELESLVALDELTSLGYKVAWEVLNAADYGVPQKRQRLFMVGMRHRRFEFPPPTHGPRTERHWVSAGSVLRPEPYGEPNPAIITYARNPDLRPDPYDGHIYNGGGRPIDLGRPSPTLLASMGGNKTPWVDTLGLVPAYHRHLLAGGAPRSGQVPGARRITVAEAARLQTFPDGMRFVGRRSSQYSQVGNAVPPLLAKVIGRALAEQMP
jgi:DNA (cytosine-5)-methyltransferase 1